MKKRILFIAFNFLFASTLHAQWQQVGPPNVVVSGLGSFGNYVFAGTDKGLFRSLDTGANWETINSGITDSSEVRIFTAIGTELFAGTPLFIYRSSNWGASWTEADSGYTASPLRDLATSGTIIYACGQNAFGVWRSEDSGKTWIRGGTGISGLNRIYSITTIGTAVFVTSASGVFRSDDSARSWSGSIFSDTSYEVIRANNNILYTITDNDVFLSKNLGQSWSLFDSDLKIEAFAFNGGDLFACGSGEVFRVKDNSGVWTPVNQGLPADYNFNSLAINGGYIFAGAGPVFGNSSVGSGIWRRPLSDFSSVHLNNQPDLNISLSPNPTTGIITVHNAPANILHVTVTSILGESVIELSHPNAADFTLDLSKLPQGTYFARFVMAGEVITRKIIKE